MSKRTAGLDIGRAIAISRQQRKKYKGRISRIEWRELKFLLNKLPISRVKKETGRSETTLLRIKKAINLKDYQLNVRIEKDKRVKKVTVKTNYNYRPGNNYPTDSKYRDPMLYQDNESPVMFLRILGLSMAIVGIVIIMLFAINNW